MAERVERKFNYILIDGSNLYHRAYSLGKTQFELSNTLYLKHHVIKIALETLDKVLSDFAYLESEIFILFDNSQSRINIRKEIDPLYKSNRDKVLADKELYAIHNLFIEILKRRSNQYRVLMAGALEADDLVKPLINILNLHRKEALMVTNDMDWARNISNQVLWYNWSTIYDKENFYSKFKFYPNEESVKIFKTIKGDPSDHIPVAIKDIGQIEFERILEASYDFKNFNDFISYIENMKDSELKIKMKRNMKLLQRNYQLVDFIDLPIPIQEYIRVGIYEPFSLKVFLQSLDLPIPDELKTKEEIESSFFD